MCSSVTASAFFHAPALPSPRKVLHQLAPYGAALGLHAGLVVLILGSPPASLIMPQRPPQSLDVRFYTVSAEDAETDARLVEPPLAAEPVASQPATPAPVQAAQIEDAPEPVLEAPLPEEDAPAPEPAEETTAALAPSPTDAPSPNINGANAQTGTDSGNGRGAPSRPSSTPGRPANGPVATTQIAVPPPQPAGRTPSFAEILTQVEPRLDPADFQVALSLGGVRDTIIESFCLSSSQANLEAADCPEGPNANSAELARYGLQGLAEASPEFIEDLSRLEFELMQLGASPSQAQRILLALEQARRDAIETPGVTRAMQRDSAVPRDNLGLGRRVTPSNALDPSGEP